MLCEKNHVSHTKSRNTDSNGTSFNTRLHHISHDTMIQGILC